MHFYGQKKWWELSNTIANSLSKKTVGDAGQNPFQMRMVKNSASCFLDEFSEQYIAI